mgnify:CR=1 FL=1
MMNRLMTVKLFLFKAEKTGNRQAVSNQLQISGFNRQKLFGALLSHFANISASLGLFFNE